LLMHALVHAADVQDRDGGVVVMATLFGLYPFLLKLYADGGYQGPQFQEGLRRVCRRVRVEIIKRSDQAKGFAVLPKRWIAAPLYNLARFSFEWSAVVAREHLIGSRRNTDRLARLRQHPLSGSKTGTDGGAHGPIDAASGRGGACLLREHEARPALPGRDLRPHRADHAQARPDKRQGRARGRRPAGHHKEG
jgi:hypothetical protein